MNNELKRTQKETVVPYVRFEVPRAVRMSMFVFWVVTPCGLGGRYQRFRGTYCVTTQKTDIVGLQSDDDVVLLGIGAV
jgi:hypothetical protein